MHCVVLNKTYEMICCKQNRPARDIQGIFERKKLAITRLKGLTALIQLKPKIKKNCDPLGIKKKYIEFIFIINIIIKISSEALI